MNIAASALFLIGMSIVVERLVQVIKAIFPILDKMQEKTKDSINIYTLIAFTLSFLFMYGARIGFFEMINVEFNIPYIGYFVNALITSYGSNFAYDTLKKLSNIKLPEVETE